MEEKSRRRSSILKQKHQDLVRSPKKTTRRISFHDKKSVREFAEREDQGTIWLPSYEELASISINETNATHSSYKTSISKQNTKTLFKQDDTNTLQNMQISMVKENCSILINKNKTFEVSTANASNMDLSPIMFEPKQEFGMNKSILTKSNKSLKMELENSKLDSTLKHLNNANKAVTVELVEQQSKFRTENINRTITQNVDMDNSEMNTGDSIEMDINSSNKFLQTHTKSILCDLTAIRDNITFTNEMVTSSSDILNESPPFNDMVDQLSFDNISPKNSVSSMELTNIGKSMIVQSSALQILNESSVCENVAIKSENETFNDVSSCGGNMTGESSEINKFNKFAHKAANSTNWTKFNYENSIDNKTDIYHISDIDIDNNKFIDKSVNFNPDDSYKFDLNSEPQEVEMKEESVLNHCGNMKEESILKRFSLNETSLNSLKINMHKLERFKNAADIENVLRAYRRKEKNSQSDSLLFNDSNLYPPGVAFLRINKRMNEPKIEQNVTNDVVSSAFNKCIFPSCPNIEALIENRLKTEKTRWQCNTMHWLHGHIVCRHVSIKSAELLIDFSIDDVQNNVQTYGAIVFTKVEICKNDKIFTNLCALDYLRHSTLMSKLPLDLRSDCPTSIQLFSFLESLDAIYQECYLLITKLNEVAIINDALVLWDESGSYIKQTIFNDATMTELEVIIKINHINTIGPSNVFLTPTFEFLQSIEEIPLGLDFLKTFLSDPTSYLKM